jgi:lysophospholipase L1-like esterase
MRPTRHAVWIPGRLTLVILVASLAAGPAAALEPGQSKPKRLYSNGDSITRAFDADFPADNVNLSWVNGYFGFWQWLFGLPNVRSHNQRISANWGSRNRKNWIAAENGARVDDLASQSSGAAGRNVTYATVMLGGNDVCRDSIADLPTDAEFEAEFRAGMETLLGNLPDGATVQVAAIPDVKRLYDVGQDKTALGIVDCELLWALTILGFPCGSMLSPFNSEADRLYVQSRNVGYNQILADVTADLALQHPAKFLDYSAATFTEPFTAGDISDIDCFHPSWEGEEKISRAVWFDGPFQSHTAGD